MSAATSYEHPSERSLTSHDIDHKPLKEFTLCSLLTQVIPAIQDALKVAQLVMRQVQKGKEICADKALAASGHQKVVVGEGDTMWLCWPI
jgi:hypothetical protein